MTDSHIRNSFVLSLSLVSLATVLHAQDPNLRFGSRIPAEARVVYQRGLEYLAKTQQPNGSWASDDEKPGQICGIDGMCVMAFLASGEDPNYGQFSSQVRAGVRRLILSQDSTGYFPNSMYHHGFAMLSLSEAYGALDEEQLWDDSTTAPRTLGKSLEMAVQCAVEAQKRNANQAWRYSPQTTSADTSVTGAVLMGLLAARNAGIDVPDDAIEKGLNYIRRSTASNGSVSYADGVGYGTSMNRSAIAVTVFAVGKKKEWKEYRAALQHLTTRLEHRESTYPFYFRYYMAQALFQGDFEAWQKWNRETSRILKQTQRPDGSFESGRGNHYGTAMSLLALALNYRFLPVYER